MPAILVCYNREMLETYKESTFEGTMKFTQTPDRATPDIHKKASTR